MDDALFLLSPFQAWAMVSSNCCKIILTFHLKNELVLSQALTLAGKRIK